VRCFGIGKPEAQLPQPSEPSGIADLNHRPIKTEDIPGITWENYIVQSEKCGYLGIIASYYPYQY
jgi:hypothetical protein